VITTPFKGEFFIFYLLKYCQFNHVCYKCAHSQRVTNKQIIQTNLMVLGDCVVILFFFSKPFSKEMEEITHGHEEKITPSIIK